MSSPTPSSSSSSSSSRSPNSDHPKSHHESDRDRDRDRSRSDPSPSSSSSGTTRPHHLLPPLTPLTGAGGGDKPGGPILANEILDPELLGLDHGNGKKHGRDPKSNPVPEKCMTFCTQSQDRMPICRMFCLRRRRPVATQKEELARLRPDAISSANPSTTTIPNVSVAQTTWRWWEWNPFTAMEKRAAPYSFIYVKGTPEGVIGRYMEEMEGDDGNRDFGSVSRGASDLVRRRGAGGWEYLDWGEHGYVLRAS